MSTTPKFSILISTFDRPQLTFRALRAIVAQSYRDFEVVILDDGSNQQTRARYLELASECGLASDQRLRWVFMPPRASRLSNLSVARNNALAEARGELITFCDDDDYWCDPEHLAIAAAEFECDPELDFLFADQQGVKEERMLIPRWQPGLLADLQKGATGNKGLYDVPLAVFCRHWTPHTNTAIFRRQLIERTGPFWPYTPMEQDVDFLYRAADNARRMRFRDAVVCIHEIPDKSKKANSSSRVTHAQRYLHRIGIAGHLLLTTRSAEVRRFAGELQAFAAQKLAVELAGSNPSAARLYAWQGLCARPSPGALWGWLRLLFRKAHHRDAEDPEY